MDQERYGIRAMENTSGAEMMIWDIMNHVKSAEAQELKVCVKNVDKLKKMRNGYDLGTYKEIEKRKNEDFYGECSLDR